MSRLTVLDNGVRVVSHAMPGLVIDPTQRGSRKEIE